VLCCPVAHGFRWCPAMKTIASCLLVCSLALLSACSGDSNSSMKKSGVVILDEAPVARALICIDVDRSLSCDDGEPSAITNDDGAFELRFPRRYSDRDFVVDGFADEEAEVAFATRATKSTTDPVRFFLTANQSSKTVSPLTTLVAVRARLLGGGNAQAIAAAEQSVIAELGLPADTNLNNFDYVAQNNTKVIAIASAIADLFAASQSAISNAAPDASQVVALALSVNDLFATPTGGQTRLASIAAAINEAPEDADLVSLASALVVSNTIPADDVQSKLEEVEGQLALIDGRYLVTEGGLTVVDVITGLEWQRCATGQTWDAQTATCQGTAFVHGVWTSPGAMAASGTSDGFGAPSLDQLRTLVYCSDTGSYDSNGDDANCGAAAHKPTINKVAFPNIAGPRFITLTPNGTFANHPQYVRFDRGGNTRAGGVWGPGVLFHSRFVRAVGPDLEVTYTHTQGGSISGVVTQSIRPWGSATTVTAVADSGFAFISWSDGVRSAQRTDVNLRASLAVEAQFERMTHTVTFNAGNGGTIIGVQSQAILHGESSSVVTAQPDAGYVFAGWDDGVSSASRMINPVERNYVITAQFNPVQYTVTYGAGSGGSITGITSQTVNYEASTTQVAAVPDVGHVFAQWSDGVTTASRTDGNITADMSVTAQFVVLSYPVTYTASAGGTIQGVVEQSVAHGGSATTVTAVPNHGYRFVKWSDNDSAQSQRTDIGVTGPLAANAEFELATFTLTYTAGVGGTLNAGVSENVQSNIIAFGNGAEVTAVASLGYRFDKWSDDVATASRTDTNVGADLNVTALFTPNAAAPTNLQATAGDGLVTLSWNAVPGATSYRLYYARQSFDVENYLAADGASLDINVTSPYERSGLLNSTTYYFRVTAVSASGEGVPSGLASATPEAPVNEGLTRICVNGEAEGQGGCSADPMVGGLDQDWGCTRDGATGLMWAVNNFNNVFFNQATSDDRYFWFNDGTGDIPNGGEEGYSGDTDSCNEVYWWTYELCNSQNYTSYVNTNGGVCGSAQWRLPTRAELLTLWGESDPLSFTIDDNYFPNFQQSEYLTSETNADNAEEFWTVELVLGQIQAQPKLFPGAPQLIWLVSDPAP
jgi:hypothetical protein